MEKYQEEAFNLHELLLNSVQYKNLKEKETIMLNDVVSFKLINDYHSLQEQYTYNKTEEQLKKLHEAKLLMDNNENVIQYKKAYKEYQILVGNITDIVFEDFSKPSIIDKIVRAK